MAIPVKDGQPPKQRKGGGAPTIHQFAFLKLLGIEMQKRPTLTAQAFADELRAEWQEVRAVLKADKESKAGKSDKSGKGDA